MTATPHIFAGFGLELEYMIVNQETLNVLPVADILLAAAGDGGMVNDVERGPFAWSNELALHVIEMKTNGPVPTLAGLAAGFQGEVRAMNRLLAPMGATLLPSAMHPWMNPFWETRLWPHGHRAVYEAYNRIFNCQGHGWSNLQSVHLNLAFNGDPEFGRLHGAIRLLLPLIPAIAASSPFVDGRATGLLDNRLQFYRQNQARIPSLTGAIIPEAVYTQSQYQETILARNYRDIAPHDPAGILQDEWLNSRGAIARFQRSAIEIRLVDIQECPRADLAVATALVAVLRALTDERWSQVAAQQAYPLAPLAQILEQTIRHGEQAVIANPAYLGLFGMEGQQCLAGELWQRLLAETVDQGDESWPALDLMMRQGPLARRLLKAAAEESNRARLAEVYGRLVGCLAQGEMFTG
jgi:gamma-glutamyl:cysteine ligase YbdK (ATP-grasp superfamily)